MQPDPLSVPAPRKKNLEPGNTGKNKDLQSIITSKNWRNWIPAPEPFCRTVLVINNICNSGTHPGGRATRTGYRSRGSMGMIHRHGIGVIHQDEGGHSRSTQGIRLLSFVQMAKIINLRAARKRAARLLDGQRAAERRAQYGVPKADRLFTKAQGEKARKDVDGHRIGNGERR